MTVCRVCYFIHLVGEVERILFKKATLINYFPGQPDIKEMAQKLHLRAPKIVSLWKSPEP